MHETSDIWKQILSEHGHQKRHKITINGNEYGESRIIRVSVKGDLFDAPGVGNAFSRTMEATVMPLPGVNGNIPPLSEIKLFTRLASADGLRVSEYIQKGVFYADTVKKDSDTGAVTVTAFDAMMKAEPPFGEPVSGGEGGYEPVRYFTVSFNDGFRNVQKFRVASGDALPTPTTPTHDGERFLAWYPDPANTPTVKGDMRFTAQWARKFAVTFDSNGGTPQAPQAFVCFDGDPTPTPETPEKAGYALSGWTPTPTETVTADADYTAQWEWERYVIAAYPAKSDYAVGETLDYAGLVVEERFEDGTAARDITADCAITPADGAEITEAGDIMVSVNYNGTTIGTFWAAVNTAYGDWWRLRGDGTLEIFCVGDMPSSGTTAPWKSYSGNVMSVTISDSVTSIRGAAFENCTNLPSIAIPDSVTSIGYAAFYGCRSLTSIAIPDSVTSIEARAFYGCSSLPSIAIPDSVTSIEERAFADCSSLTSIAIPDSVTSIEEWAFVGCTNLPSIAIPDSVTSIGNTAFYGCSSLTSIAIPDSVTSIEERTFENCTNLPSIAIPDSVTSIGYAAFYGCRSLTSIAIPDGITSIRHYTFYDCRSLTSIAIPDSVTSIEERAFSGCTNLADVYYSGTEAQWNAIIIDNRKSGNVYLNLATKHYNSSGPT